MNAVTSPLTWSFLNSFGLEADSVPAAPFVKPAPRPAAFDPSLCTDIVTGSDGTDALSAAQETTLAWFMTEDDKDLDSAPRQKVAKLSPQVTPATVAANAFFAAMQAMSCRAKAQAQA